jgi:hypothetical protein
MEVAMLKGMKTPARAYVLFRVNRTLFLSYDAAQRFMASLAHFPIHVRMDGFHLLKGWRCLWMRHAGEAAIYWAGTF